MTRLASATRLLAVALLSLAALSGVGCKNKDVVQAPDYTRPTNGPALRKITDPAELPNLARGFQGRDANLIMALDRSIGWFNTPSSKRFFPLQDISHDAAAGGAKAFRQLVATAQSAEEFQSRVYADFDCYQSVGWDDKGTVLFTGYYSPIFTASAQQTPEYRYPLYKRPADLVADPVTGETKGRSVNGSMQTYPTRAQIEQGNLLAGNEFVWLRDPLDCYIIQVNGSAKLTMTDGSTHFIGYAGNNGHEYTSIGKMLIEDGKIDKNRLSLPTLRDYFRAHPNELSHYTQRNDRFVFFQNYAPDAWPAGSLGVKVTPFRSLATDKSIFPRGCVILSQTSVPATGGGGAGEQLQRFDQFMADQDAGGAIRAAGRSDIYMGVGPEAEQSAGRQFAEGRLYYFVLKPEKVAAWQAQLGSANGKRPM